MKVDLEKVVDDMMKNPEIARTAGQINGILGDRKNLLYRLLIQFSAGFYLMNAGKYREISRSLEIQEVKENINFIINSRDLKIEDIPVRKESDRELFESVGLGCLLEAGGKEI